MLSMPYNWFISINGKISSLIHTLVIDFVTEIYARAIRLSLLTPNNKLIRRQRVNAVCIERRDTRKTGIMWSVNVGANYRRTTKYTFSR